VVSLDEEVEERLREERMENLWKRAWPWLLGALLLLLASVGGWQIWDAQQKKAAGIAGAALMDGQEKLQSGDLAGAKAIFEGILKSAPAGYRAAATMELGAVAVGEGNLETAVARFEDAARLFRAPEMKDLALLKAAYAAADKADGKAMEIRLKSLIEGTGPYSSLAQELLAAEYWDDKNIDRARDLFTELAQSPSASQGVKERASRALQVIGPKPEVAPPAPTGAGPLAPAAPTAPQPGSAPKPPQTPATAPEAQKK
jgi:hypothetical protein